MSLNKLIPDQRSRRIALLTVVMALCVGLARFSLGKYSVVDGMSMYPTFGPNDVVHARTLNQELTRGDVVIVRDDQDEEVIKRIIGLPGETVTLYRGFVYIDRRRLLEPYLPKFTYTFKRNQLNEHAASWQLAADQYFVLGDNRMYSADSRHYGPIKRDQIDRMVEVPANATRPVLSDITLSENGKVISGKLGLRMLVRHSSPDNS